MRIALHDLDFFFKPVLVVQSQAKEVGYQFFLVVGLNMNFIQNINRFDITTANTNWACVVLLVLVVVVVVVVVLLLLLF